MIAPPLSIVVVFHDMQREAARTLYSLSAAHQNGAGVGDYGVIAVDNASAQPLDARFVAGFGPNFRLIRHETTSASPVAAVNLGVGSAESSAVAIIVDGARMASPGLVFRSLQALALADLALVYARSWHLGPDVQNKSCQAGYDQAEEDRLLAAAGWEEDGYALFSISTLAQSSAGGFLGPIPPEFSWVALPHRLFDDLGGFDERFQAPGGGLVNQDFRNRAVSRAGVTPIEIIGEGVFHQVHGGVATNVPLERHPIRSFKAEYRAITGEEFRPAPAGAPLFFGSLSPAARSFLS
ncbi:glycosyltransferase family 2 protein [Jiella sonneratiae]|uniref:Glycosyltransferase family 2 protein n=1 Tax=Jiella sonneratiae TaxID=2816856 RepID=A0ABS3J085_9HYPH|nr:hypothetical protein [Jiella sonneratiae]MBO0903072.1 hypothetical protein [Jiella sonneratiae]